MSNLFLFSRHHTPTNSVTPLSAYKPTHNPQFLQSLWRRANARNVSFFTLYGSQFTFSTQSLTLNYLQSSTALHNVDYCNAISALKLTNSLYNMTVLKINNIQSFYNYANPQQLICVTFTSKVLCYISVFWTIARKKISKARSTIFGSSVISCSFHNHLGNKIVVNYSYQNNLWYKGCLRDPLRDKGKSVGR